MKLLSDARSSCDKTTPARRMCGILENKPIIYLVTGSMMPGSYQGMSIGTCTDCRGHWTKFGAGILDFEDVSALIAELAPTVRFLPLILKAILF